MNPVNRRTILKRGAVLGVASLAGCTGSTDDGNNENANGGGEGDRSDGGSGEPASTPTQSGTQLTDIVGIPSHEWRGASILEVTVENRTDDTLDLVQVEANLYVDNTRMAHSYTNISSLTGGTKTTSQIRFTDYDQNPCNATRYDLFPNFYYDNTQYEQRMEYEFNPDFCE